MKLLNRLLNRGNSLVGEYDYYTIQQRLGGLFGRWEEVDKREDFLDKASGVATYSDGSDITLRCFGVKKFQDREIKKQLWITYSREDIEEEIEDRKKRVGKKETNKDDDLEKYLRILNTAKDEEREKLETLIGMMNNFYQNQYGLLSGLQQQNSESNKYDVWKQGIHEISEVGKELVKELRDGKENRDEDVTEESQESFEEYKRRALPPAKEEIRNNRASKSKNASKIPGAILLMAKFIEKHEDPAIYLRTLAITFPKAFAAFQSVKSLDELIEKIKPFVEMLPVLGTEEAKLWLGSMFDMLTLHEKSESALAEGQYESEKPTDKDDSTLEKPDGEGET